MLFRQMKYFTAVVDCNSFTEAAEQCYISQSAISQQIRALEKDPPGKPQIFPGSCRGVFL